jgi:hypothetical protein
MSMPTSRIASTTAGRLRSQVAGRVVLEERLRDL